MRRDPHAIVDLCRADHSRQRLDDSFWLDQRRRLRGGKTIVPGDGCPIFVSPQNQRKEVSNVRTSTGMILAFRSLSGNA